MDKRSGSAPNTYRYQGCQIEVMPYFLYEVSLYRTTFRRVNLLLTRYYTSGSLLKVKENEVIKRFRTFNIERFITLLGAPMSFIEENNLPLYELKKHEKRKN